MCITKDPQYIYIYLHKPTNTHTGAESFVSIAAHGVHAVYLGLGECYREANVIISLVRSYEDCEYNGNICAVVQSHSPRI